MQFVYCCPKTKIYLTNKPENMIGKGWSNRIDPLIIYAIYLKYTCIKYACAYYKQISICI